MTPRHKQHWTAQEDAILRYEAGEYTIPALARRLKRTPGAVRWRLHELGVNLNTARKTAAGMTVPDVQQALGLTRGDTVYDWVRRGWLRATVQRVGGRAWVSVDVTNLCDFLAERGALLAGLRPSRDWAATVRECRAELEARLVRTRDLVRALGYANSSMPSYLRRTAGFPCPALSLGNRNGGDWYDRAAVRAWLAAHPQYGTAAAWRVVGGGEG